MWQRRIAAQLDAGAAAVTLIGNRGAGSGASLEHPHEQLFAHAGGAAAAARRAPRVRALPQPLRRLRALRPRSSAPATRLVLAGDVGAWVPDGQPLHRRAVAGPGRARGGLPRARTLRAVAPAPAARARRGQGGDRRRAAQLLAAHGAGRPARRVPLAPRVRAAHARRWPASSSARTSPLVTKARRPRRRSTARPCRRLTRPPARCRRRRQRRRGAARAGRRRPRCRRPASAAPCTLTPARSEARRAAPRARPAAGRENSPPVSL